MVDAKTNASRRKMILARLTGPSADRSDEDFARSVTALERELTDLVQSQVQVGGLSPLHGAGEGLSVMLTAPAARTYEVVAVLRAHGAREVIVQDTDYVFDMSRSSFDQVAATLGLQGAKARSGAARAPVDGLK